MFLLMLQKRITVNCQSNKYKQETEVKQLKNKSEFPPTTPDDTLSHSTDFINITTAMKFVPVHIQEMNRQQPLG